MTVVPNAQQREYWNGDDSREWVEHAALFDDMLGPIGHLVLERAGIAAGHRVLDVGCGNGALTMDAATLVGPRGHARGIDLSAPMLSVARARASEAGHENVDFVVADAQVDDLGGPFDRIVSRFGIMFFDDPDAAFAHLAEALAPGGRVSFSCWAPRIENHWVAVPMAAMIEAIGPPPVGLPGSDEPGPFRYEDPDPLVTSLRRAGLDDVVVARADVEILLGGHGGLVEARDFIARSGMTRSLLGEATPEQWELALDAIATALEPYVADDGVRIGSASWLVTADKP